jgi:hypothetical protein
MYVVSTCITTILGMGDKAKKIKKNKFGSKNKFWKVHFIKVSKF